jgi:hypothetical protein
MDLECVVIQTRLGARRSDVQEQQLHDALVDAQQLPVVARAFKQHGGPDWSLEALFQGSCNISNMYKSFDAVKLSRALAINKSITSPSKPRKTPSHQGALSWKTTKSALARQLRSSHAGLSTAGGGSQPPGQADLGRLSDQHNAQAIAVVALNGTDARQFGQGVSSQDQGQTRPPWGDKTEVQGGLNSLEGSDVRPLPANIVGLCNLNEEVPRPRGRGRPRKASSKNPVLEGQAVQLARMIEQEQRAAGLSREGGSAVDQVGVDSMANFEGADLPDTAASDSASAPEALLPQKATHTESIFVGVIPG